MNTSVRLNTLAGALLLALSFSAAHAASLTYHGNLQDGGKPANGNYDIRLTLYPSQTGGTAIGSPITLYAVPVHDGTFSTEVDFGAAANNGNPAWVAAAVAPAGSGQFVTLDSRTPASLDEPSGTCDSYWSLSGNSGNPSGSFLGTSDNEPLVLKADGVPLATFTGSSNDTINSVALGNGATAPGYASVALGSGAQATGPAAIAIGEGAVAGAHDALAAGDHAYANYGGSFVWADDSNASGFGDTANDQFLIRATGGVGINTNQPSSNTSLTVVGTETGIAATANGTGIYGYTTSNGAYATGVLGSTNQQNADGVLAANGAGGTALYLSTVNSGQVFPIIGSSVGASLSAGGQWVNASDRNLKSGFTPIDAERILAKVVSLPVTRWYYKSEGSSEHHIGPMAQDFYSAFKLGNTDKAIGTVDEGGVALAAIQGLNQKLEHEYRKVADENAALKAQNAALTAKLAQLDARMTSLEVAQHAMPTAPYQVAERGE